MDGMEIGAMRRSSRIAGHLVAARAGISRSRLSAIERGQVEPNSSELQTLCSALSALIDAKSQLAKAAEAFGAAELAR